MGKEGLGHRCAFLCFDIIFCECRCDGAHSPFLWLTRQQGFVYACNPP